MVARHPNVTEMTSSSIDLDDLEWVKLNKDMDLVALRPESFTAKFQRKFLENPFLLIGCTATLGALSYGLWSFQQGNRKMSQLMMRSRVIAQGFTVIAFVAGVALSAKK